MITLLIAMGAPIVGLSPGLTLIAVAVVVMTIDTYDPRLLGSLLGETR